MNPLCYRGYVYDSEIQFYYLQSRYYDPELCRFLNADSYASTGQGILGNNMFAYCLNSPTIGADPCGTCLHRLDFWNDCEKCGGETFGEKWNDFTEWCSNKYESIKAYVTNTDPAVALDGGFIAFYKGAVVINLPFEWTAFSFGVIVLGSQYESNPFGENTLNHEYGHFLQLKKYGIFSYTFTIAIPSVVCNLLDRADMLPWTYYSSPWEYEADMLGEVSRSDYASWASKVSSIYSYYSLLYSCVYEVKK